MTAEGLQSIIRMQYSGLTTKQVVTLSYKLSERVTEAITGEIATWTVKQVHTQW